MLRRKVQGRWRDDAGEVADRRSSRRAIRTRARRRPVRAAGTFDAADGVDESRTAPVQNGIHGDWGRPYSAQSRSARATRRSRGSPAIVGVTARPPATATLFCRKRLRSVGFDLMFLLRSLLDAMPSPGTHTTAFEEVPGARRATANTNPRTNFESNINIRHKYRPLPFGLIHVFVRFAPLQHKLCVGLCR